MAATIHPLEQWLGIRWTGKNPNHYELLGIPLFETEPPVIFEGAKKQKAKLQPHLQGPQKDIAGKILRLVEQAEAQLLNPGLKAQYDQVLHRARHEASDANSREKASLSPADLLPPQAVPVSPPQAYSQIPANSRASIPQAVPFVPQAVPLTPPMAQPIAPPVAVPRAVPPQQVVEEEGGPYVRTSRALTLPPRRNNSNVIAAGLLVISLAFLVGTFFYARETGLLDRIMGKESVATTSETPSNPSVVSDVPVDQSRKRRLRPQPEEDAEMKEFPSLPPDTMEPMIAPPTKEMEPEKKKNIPDPAPEPPAKPKKARPADESEIKAVNSALLSARQALSKRELASALEEIDLAAVEAGGDETLAGVDRHQTLYQAVQGFWNTVGEGMKNLKEGDEFEADGMKYIVVESSDKQVVLRSRGRNTTYTVEKLSVPLAISLAEKGLPTDSEILKVYKAGFLAVDPKGDLSKARSLLEEAEAQGANVAHLQELLDELEKSS